MDKELRDNAQRKTRLSQMLEREDLWFNRYEDAQALKEKAQAELADMKLWVDNALAAADAKCAAAEAEVAEVNLWLAGAVQKLEALASPKVS